MEGSTVRAHLEAAERATGRVPQMLLDAPALPEGCETLWSDFHMLRSTAGSNGFGPNRITFAEMEAYQRMNHFRFEPWEVRAILQADSAFIARSAKKGEDDD